MIENWTIKKLIELIENQVEESINLEYKAADSLGKSDSKKKEISKDVSAMANSDGGIIIYGISEYSSKEKRHLPEKLDPVDRIEYTKEWLEHVINNINPKIKNLLIIPINITNENNKCIYVVVIPKSSTAHQTIDFRYYKRYNFESVPMLDFEIRDIMNRSQIPDVEVEFDSDILSAGDRKHENILKIMVCNISKKIVNNYKLEFNIPNKIQVFPGYLDKYFADKKNKIHIFTYISKNVLFPKERYDIGKELQVRYRIDSNTDDFIEECEKEGEPLVLNWLLYADDMPAKSGNILFSELHNF